MAGAESPVTKQEQQNPAAENTNENPRERNPPGGGGGGGGGGGNRGPRGRKGGTRFSGGRGGGMGGGNRNNDGPVRVSHIFHGTSFEHFSAFFVPARHVCSKLVRNTFTGFKLVFASRAFPFVKVPKLQLVYNLLNCCKPDKASFI